MNIPRVSIVIATYNYGRFLPEALGSILSQTYEDWEAIIVDDGSTDNTKEVVETYLADPRFHYHRTMHFGVSAAKNQGIVAAKGEFVAFLDADDCWLPTKLEKQIQRIQQDSRIGVVYSDRQTIDEFGNKISNPAIVLHRGEVVSQMFRENFVCFSSSMIRKSVFDAVGAFDESIPLAIDYDLWLRVASKYHFDYVDERLVMYRTGHANLSRRGEERLHIALAIMDRFLNKNNGRTLLTSREIRRAYSETFEHLAYATRDKAKLKAFVYYARAIGFDPTYPVSYRGLMSLFLSERMRKWARKFLMKRPRIVGG